MMRTGHKRRAGVVWAPGVFPFSTGYPDEELRRRADVEGRARLYTEPWGMNRQPHLMNEIDQASEVARAVQGHQLIDQLTPLQEQIEGTLLSTVDALSAVDMAIDAYERAVTCKYDLQDRLIEKDLPVP